MMGRVNLPEPNVPPTLAEVVGNKVKLKLNANRNAPQTLLLGFSTMGVIGWSVVVPTLIGAAAGMWLDSRIHGPHNWTLALLVAGLCLGCFNAWRWVETQVLAMKEDQTKNDL